MRHKGSSEGVKTVALDFEYKVMGDGAGTFEGYANAFNNVDFVGDITAAGAFADDLEKFIADGFVGGINHDWDCPIGKILDAKEDMLGLFIKAQLSSISSAQDARTLMQEGVLRKMSIGYRVKVSEWVDGDGARAYWESVGYTPTAADQSNMERAIKWWGEIRLIKKASVFEASPVTMPANEQARIVAVKGDQRLLPDVTDFERSLRDAGFSRTEAKAIIASGYRALLREAEGDSEDDDPATDPNDNAVTVKADTADVLAEVARFRALCPKE